MNSKAYFNYGNRKLVQRKNKETKNHGWTNGQSEL